MSTHNICFHGEIINYEYFSVEKNALYLVLPMFFFFFFFHTVPKALFLLNPHIPCFTNSVDPDQLASEEAN